MDAHVMDRKIGELAANLRTGRPIVLIVSGREHNVLVQHVGAHVIGRVALNKVAMLIDRPGRGGPVVKVVSPNDEKSAIGPGDELLHSEPCVVGSSPRIMVSIESIDIYEEPWRPFLPDSAFLADGSVDCDALCEAMPAFADYRVKGKGFVGSPEAWKQGAPPADGELRVAKDDESSSGQ
jgi:hypothetical protein